MSSFDQQYNDASSAPCFGFSFHPFRREMSKSDRESPSSGHPNQQEIDILLSEALNKLTFEERQKQQEVLHGVDEQLQEVEYLIENTLLELENYLDNTKSGTYYEKAEQMNPEYVRDKAFRIMFLRGNRYDAKAAASQMIRFFEQKNKLFGEDKLVKDITAEDLDEDDIACLRTGAIQVLGRDTSNRQIFIMVPSLRAFKHVQTELRSIYFMFMNALKSQETQLRGAIAITYTVDNHKDAMKGVGYTDNMRLLHSLPSYIAATHMCSDSNSAESILWNMAIKMMPAKNRARLRLHFGSNMECQYLLSTYGIPSQMLPFYSGTTMVNLENHNRWCNSVLQIGAPPPQQPVSNDSSSPPPMVAGQTNANDVLYVGKKKNDNVGNQRLRALVRDHSALYDAGTNEKKRQVVDGLLAEVRKSGGRFLQQVTVGQQKCWEELNVEEARAKVTQLFRNNRRRPDASREKVHGGYIISDTPRPNDVVFGKGTRSQGGELLHHLIKNRSHEYDSLNRGMKKDLVDSILHRIKGQGGRFLQPTDAFGEFLEVTDDMARARISKYFRNNRRSKTALQTSAHSKR